MQRVMLDTCYWIELKENPPKRAEFERVASREDVEVLFSYGNFIDLAQATEQDELSEIIATTVNVYIPAMDYEGESCVRTDDPLGLIPDDIARQHAAAETIDFGEKKTLRYIFRISDWDAGERYEEMVQTAREIHSEFGFDNTLAATFLDEIEQNGDRALLYEHELDITEYVRKVVEVYRIAMMQEEENINANNVADMEICSQAILTECDILLIESKWKNLGLVEKVLSRLEGDQVEVEVLDDLGTFLSDPACAK